MSQMDDEKYMKSIYKLHDKCQQMQRENERFVARLHYIKKLTKRQQKDVVILKSRLDMYNDNWRTAQPNTKIRRVPKKNKLSTKSSSGTVPVNVSSPAVTTPSALRTNTSNGNAAPISKRKRSSMTGGSAKRQSVSSHKDSEFNV